MSPLKFSQYNFNLTLQAFPKIPTQEVPVFNFDGTSFAGSVKYLSRADLPKEKASLDQEALGVLGLLVKSFLLIYKNQTPTIDIDDVSCLDEFEVFINEHSMIS